MFTVKSLGRLAAPCLIVSATWMASSAYAQQPATAATQRPEPAAQLRPFEEQSATRGLLMETDERKGLITSLAAQTKILTRDGNDYIGYETGKGEFFDCRNNRKIPVGNGSLRRTMEDCPNVSPIKGELPPVYVFTGTLVQGNGRVVKIKLGDATFDFFLPESVEDRSRLKRGDLRAGVAITFASVIPGRIEALVVGDRALMSSK